VYKVIHSQTVKKASWVLILVYSSPGYLFNYQS
jgi:hypothetical protein